MTFMPRWDDIVNGLQSSEVEVVDRAWELLLILAEADSSLMRPFDAIELALDNGLFGPERPAVVEWIDLAPSRDRILLKALVWLYEQGIDLSAVSFQGWVFQDPLPEELVQLQQWGIVFVQSSGGSA